MLKNRKLLVLVITAILGMVGFQVSQGTVDDFLSPLFEQKQVVDINPKDQEPKEPKQELIKTQPVPQAIEPASAAPKEAFNKVSVISPERRVHILMGDETGGGHMFGAGKPCKSEFPSDWDEGKIIDSIELIAANDNASWEKQRNGYHVHEQMVEGVEIRVVKGRQNEQVITAYPLNMGRNPCPANDR